MDEDRNADFGRHG